MAQLRFQEDAMKTITVDADALNHLLSENGIPLSGEESSEYAEWYNAQPSDPSASHCDPVVVFRLAKLSTFTQVTA